MKWKNYDILRVKSQKRYDEIIILSREFVVGENESKDYFVSPF